MIGNGIVRKINKKECENFMVLDVIENADNYYSFGPLFQKGLEFLKRDDIASLPLGKIQI